MKYIPRVLVSLLFLMLFGATIGSASAGSKATICHIPPGNPSNAHTIVIGESAVPAHLAHGDSLGECGSGESVAGASSLVAAVGPVFVICDEREGEIGRLVSISAIGRLSNERLECD